MNTSPLAHGLGMVFRGGAGLVCASMVWSLLIPQNGDFFMRLLFGWLSSAWVVFPVGAALAWLLPRCVGSRSFLASVGIGLLIGLASSLLLAVGVWLWFNHRELIGLVANRHSQGYASYSLSVQSHLRDAAWRMVGVIVPIVAVWVTGWAIWINRSRQNNPGTFAPVASTQKVSLRLNRRVFRGFIVALAGFAIFATAALFITSWVSRGVQVPLTSFLMVGPAAAGLVIFGPWLGPLINPGGGHTVAWQFTAVALPVLLSGLAPFVFLRQPVRLSKAVTAWCSLVTAVLFWTGTGVLSLGWSLG